MAEDPKSAEILKPVVRGRDIRRWRAEWADQWLIATFPAVGLNIDEYPAVKRHLLSFGKARLEQSGERLPDGTMSRKKTNHAWYELQDTCAYHEEFAKEKLLWMDLTERGRFAYDESGAYSLNTTFILTGASIKYLCAILNSQLATWFIKTTALNSGMGVSRWVRFTVESIPVPQISVADQQSFVKLTDRIRSAHVKKDSHFDSKIDTLVYALYELSVDEVQAIEGRETPGQ